MDGIRLSKILALSLSIFFICACNASSSWKKYSFGPSFMIFSERGKLEVHDSIQVLPVVSGNRKGTIDSIQIIIPDTLNKEALQLPKMVIIYAKNGWHSSDSIKFYVKGLRLYAKKNPERVSCNIHELCRLDYSLLPLSNRTEASSYLDYIQSSPIDTHAYVDSLLLNSTQPFGEIKNNFFAECGEVQGCIRKGILKEYMFEYPLQLPEKNWVEIDIEVKNFLSNYVKFE